MSDLKPCPFCGGEAKIWARDYKPLGNLYGIECTGCEVWVDCRKRSDEEAVAYWNRRAVQSIIAALTEALEHLVKEAKLDGMDKRAGWDCWISMADAALSLAKEKTSDV